MTLLRPATFLAFLAALGLSACGNSRDDVGFDGQYFRTKLSKVDRQLDVFTVSARPVSASLAGAREAARYEAVSYCVNTFGGSDIIWSVGPDTPAEQLRIQDDTLVFHGVCPQGRS